MPRAADPARGRWGQLKAGASTWTRALLRLPSDPQLLAAHRDTVLARTRIAAWAAAVVMPSTIVGYFWLVEHLPIRLALLASVLADAGVAVVLLAVRAVERGRRGYHLPFFLLVGVVCSGTEAALLQWMGGARGSQFLFPYFLILFGIATLFPARLRWAVASVAMVPLTYLVSELVMWGELAQGRPVVALLLLLETGFIAVIGNRVTTRTFFREVEHRQALERANTQLRELDKAKSDFFANLSHDLKTPLNVVIGPVQAVMHAGEGLDARSRRYLEMALRGARRLEGMIDDLLELARLESGVIALALQPTDVRALLAAFVETTGAYAASVGQRVSLDAPPGELWADVDPDKLDRVVANLVSNALKFSPPGSEVRVRLEAGAQHLAVEVTDQGPGIPPEEHAHIFGRFARAGTGGTRAPRGVGIGLAVVREFAELHGGSASVRSAPGRGATFRVELPRYVAGPHAGPPPETPALRARPEGPAPGHGEEQPRLLLVEDDDETRTFLAAELGRDMEVLWACDGESALRLASQRPDVVLLDVALGGDPDGIEACRRLRKHPLTAHVPVLVFSARGDQRTRTRAFEAGADDFLHKPVAPAELRARLDALLGRRGASPHSGPGGGPAGPRPTSSGSHH